MRLAVFVKLTAIFAFTSFEIAVASPPKIVRDSPTPDEIADIIDKPIAVSEGISGIPASPKTAALW